MEKDKERRLPFYQQFYFAEDNSPQIIKDARLKLEYYIQASSERLFIKKVVSALCLSPSHALSRNSPSC